MRWLPQLQHATDDVIEQAFTGQLTGALLDVTLEVFGNGKNWNLTP